MWASGGRAIERVKRASNDGEVDQLCSALDAVIDSFGADQRRRLADELVNGLNRLGIQTPAAVSIAVRRSSTTAPREDVAVKLVEAALNLPLTVRHSMRSAASQTRPGGYARRLSAAPHVRATRQTR